MKYKIQNRLKGNKAPKFFDDQDRGVILVWEGIIKGDPKSWVHQNTILQLIEEFKEEMIAVDVIKIKKETRNENT